MFSDSDHSPRFTKRSRPFKGFRVDAVERNADSGESAVRGRLSGKDIEVRYVETSGEFRVVSSEGDVEEMSRSDLRDLGPALERYESNVPWADSVSASVLKAVSDAIFPTSLSSFRPRSISDLGASILLTGWTKSEEIDLILDTRTGVLSMIVTSSIRKASRRAVTSQEALELVAILEERLDGQRVTSKRSLFALVVEAARRVTRH